MKTGLRPYRPNNLPVGSVEQATPTIVKAIGSVARFTDGAKSVPIMPAINTIIEVPDIIRAKAMVSRHTVAGSCRIYSRFEKRTPLLPCSEAGCDLQDDVALAVMPRIFPASRFRQKQSQVLSGLEYPRITPASSSNQTILENAAWSKLCICCTRKKRAVVAKLSRTRVTGTFGEFGCVDFGSVFHITHGLSQWFAFRYFILCQQVCRDCAQGNGSTAGSNANFQELTTIKFFDFVHTVLQKDELKALVMYILCLSVHESSNFVTGLCVFCGE